MKILVFFFGIVFLTINAKATDDIILPPPNAAEISRFGAVPVGLFTGSMQYDIPLYTLKNSHLTLPISLKYSSNGLIVDNIASTVGYDWSLDAGGVIIQHSNGGSGAFRAGMDYSSYLSTQHTAEEKYYYLTWHYAPSDIFVFTLPGYSGSFYFDKDGKPAIVKNADNLSIDYDYDEKLGLSKFEITTPDGIRYVFAIQSSDYYSHYNTWYLSSIQHPSGDHIDFNYSDKKQNMKNVVRRKVYYEMPDPDDPGNWPLPEINHSKEWVAKVPTYDRYLESIEFEGVGSIVFSNVYDRPDVESIPRVDEITVRNADGENIKSIKLKYLFPHCNNSYDIHTTVDAGDYNNKTDHLYRMFLDKVEVNNSIGNKEYFYGFGYNDINNLPPRNSYSKDLWGYFNGKLNNDIFNLTDYQWIDDTGPTFGPYNYNDFKTIFTGGASFQGSYNGSADHSFSQKGMLNHISYPTGGYSNIEYEAHRIHGDIEVGGCRVAKVKTYSLANSTPEVKVYHYDPAITIYENINFNTYSSYVLHNYEYTIDCSIGDPKNMTAHWIELRSDAQSNFQTGSYHLCYGKVEILHGENGENGSEEHEFRAVPQRTSTSVQGPLVVTPLKRSNTNLFNGIPTRIAYYKKNHVLQKEIVYDYDFDNTKYQKSITNNNILIRPQDLEILVVIGPEDTYTCAPLQYESLLQFIDVSEYTLYSNFPYLQSKKETEVDNNGNDIVTESFYDYCEAPHTNVRSVTVKTSQGKDVKTVYRYPTDFTIIPADAPLNTMRNKNMIKYIIEQQQWNGNNLIAATYNKYTNNISPKLGEVYQLETKTPLTAVQFNGLNDYGDIKTSSQYKLNTTIDSYDIFGNVLQYHKQNNINTSYIWGYNNTYPIAKVENASSDRIAYTSFEEYNAGNWSYSSGTIIKSPSEAKIGETYLQMAGANCISKSVLAGKYRIEFWAKSSIPAITGGSIIEVSTSNPDRNGWTLYVKEITLSTNSSIVLSGYGDIDDLRLYPSNALMTTYTYDPLIGMTSETDPNGKTTYYEYDSFGRLYRIRDHNGTIIKQNTYHYANQ